MFPRRLAKSRSSSSVCTSASIDDTHTCVEILRQQILPAVNLFAYGQVESPYGSGQFVKDVREHFADDVRVVTSEIKSKDAIMDSIKEFLGKGR